MPLLTISDLVTVTTFADALALELTIATELGLPTTAWQPLTPEMAILGVNATIVASYSATVNQIAAGGFSSLAAVIPGTDPAFTDSDGFNTSWSDLISVNVYNVTRIPATFATGSITLQNTGASPYPLTLGQFHIQHPVTGATYSNTTAPTIPASGTAVVAFQADAGYPGNSGTLAAGIVPIILTPLSGVTALAPVVSLIGTDAETNAALLIRDQSKLGSLSPNGAAQSYVFVATSIPTPANQATAPVPFNHYSVTAPITRVATTAVNGTVLVYLANSAGAPSAPDIASVNAAIQAICVPLSVTAVVAAAGQVALNLVYTVYFPASRGVASSTIVNNINTSIAAYCATVPIGGVTGALPNIIPYTKLEEIIIDANPGTIEVVLTNPPGDLSISPTSVPVPGAPTGTVIQV
jgi:hypothetical protein